MTTAHGATQFARDKRVAFRRGRDPKHQVKRWRPNAWMDGC